MIRKLLFTLLLGGAAAARAQQTAFYFDALAGSDSNACTLAAPCASITKANSLLTTATAGNQYLFNRGAGQVYRDAFLLCKNLVTATASTTYTTNPPACSGVSGNPVFIGKYGTGPDPIIDAADPLTLTWISVDGTTFSAPLSNPVTELYADFGTAEGGQLLQVPNSLGAYAAGTTYQPYDMVYDGTNGYVHGTTATTGTAVAIKSSWSQILPAVGTVQTFSGTNTGLQNVQATAGSWWLNRATSTLYVHMSDGSSPATHTFEGTRRDACFEGVGVNYVTYDALVCAHPDKWGDLFTAYSDSTVGGYYTNIGNQLLNTVVYNWGGIVTDLFTTQTKYWQTSAAVLMMPDGANNPHKLTGDLIDGGLVGRVGRSNGFFGQFGNRFGVACILCDGGAIKNLVLATHNTQAGAYTADGTAYSTTISTPNLGRVSHLYIGDNQTGFKFTSVGGTVDHIKCKNMSGQCLQIGGPGSTSTPSVPQTLHHIWMAHTQRNATQTNYNGIDCNSAVAGVYEDHITGHDINSAVITTETGCLSPHITNLLADQTGAAYPATTGTNSSLMYYFTGDVSASTSTAASVLSNNGWVLGSTGGGFGRPAESYNCTTWFAKFPDSNSYCQTTSGFNNIAADDLRLTSASPFATASTTGGKIGALDDSGEGVGVTRALTVTPMTGALGSTITPTCTSSLGGACLSPLYTTSNASVAQISNGVVQFAGSGTASITATDIDGWSTTTTVNVTGNLYRFIGNLKRIGNLRRQ